MPQIQLKIAESVHDFIQKNYPNAVIRLLHPLPKAIAQYGQTCKLYALSVAMNYAFTKNPVQHIPPAARKRDILSGKKTTPSLRKSAKALGSQVGEIYDGTTLLQLATQNGYQESAIIEPDNEHYVETIKAQINQDEAPIVFFDVNPETGEPENQESSREHAAVVVGYFVNEAQCQFILAQWGNYYYVDAGRLRDSANQLARIRKPEEFYKLGGLWRQTGDRLDVQQNLLSQIDKLTRKVVTKPVDFSFKNKLLVIKSSSPEPAQVLPMTPQIMGESQGLTFQLDTLEFLRLDRLINFLEIDTIRPNSYTAEELELFANHFDFKKQLIDLTRNTEVDESLEDDIYRQNPKRTRSITELVSNAIDAQSESVYIAITDGKYRVLDLGVGMSPEIIFRKLLIPKASSKVDAQDSIGQFGLGFYTALAHLNTLDNSVVVRTKALNHPGYRIEFRKIKGKICVNISPDATISISSTEITVSSEQINKESFCNALIQNIRYLNRATIYINDVIANKSDLTRYVVSNSSIILDDQRLEKGSTLTLAGITIQTEVDKESSNTLHAVWNLAKSLVSISESRNQIRLDSKAARKEVGALIDFADSLADDLKLKYLNTIASLVFNLQQNNTSQKVGANVFYYLQTKIKQLYANKKQVPDLLLLKPLVTEGVVVLHPLLVDPNWQTMLGFEPKEWQANQAEQLKIKVIVAAMNPELGMQLIHDESTNTIYLDEVLYQHIGDPTEFAQLDLLFSLPPGKIQGSWKGLSDKKKSEESGTGSAVLIALNQAEKPHSSLYKKHGILAQYGDQFADGLSEEQRALLSQAQTLMQIYPMQRTMLSDEHRICESVRGYKKLIPFTAYGKQFYLGESNYSQYVILDHSFKQVLHRNDLLIFAKAVQLNKTKKLVAHDRVTLEQTDRLLVVNAAKKYTQIFNGTSELCIEKKFDFNAELIVLNDEYFMVVEKASTHVYNRNNELIVQLPQRYCYKISDKPLQIAAGWRSEAKYWEGIYCIDTKRNIIAYNKENKVRSFAGQYMTVRHPTDSDEPQNDFEEEPIEFHQNNGLLGRFFSLIFPPPKPLVAKRRKIEHFSLQHLNCLDVISPSGTVLYSYASKKASNIDFIECEQVKGRYFITLQYADYERELLELIPNDFEPLEWSGDRELKLIAVIPNEHIIGYPAQAYLRHTKSAGLSLYLINRPIVINGIQAHQFFGKNIPTDRYFAVNYNPLTSKELTLIEYQELGKTTRIIIDENQIIKLPTELIGLQISKLFRDHDYYKVIVQGKKNCHFIIDKKGNLLIKGTTIAHYKANEHELFLVDDHIIMRADGVVLLDNKHISYIVPIPKLNLLHVHFKRIRDRSQPDNASYSGAVINYEGRTVIAETTEHISNLNGHLSYTLDGKNYHISRDGHYQQLKYLRLTTWTVTPSTPLFQEQYLYFYEEQEKCYLVDAQGNTMFAGGLQNAYSLGNIITTYKHSMPENLFLVPLSPQQLLLPAVQENISFLNTLQLSPFSYGSCLRFIELDPYQFKVIYPYMTTLEYVPTGVQVNEFVEFFKSINDEVSEHQGILISALNLIYSIAGSYSQFNLADKLLKLFALYGIYAIERVYKELLSQRDKIIIDPDGITAQNSLIRELSKEAGMMVYYLFFDSKDLFSQKRVLLDSNESTGAGISIIDLLTAQRLDAGIAGYAANKDEFRLRIARLAHGAHKHHAERRLTHAVYHQAPPEKCLYLREFIQNALDAYADSSNAQRSVDIDLTTTPDLLCVLSLRDSGVGMTLEQVFKYLLIPGISSKRHAASGKFIGGRGVGLFTAFHGTKELLVKTSTEDGKTTYVILTPQYTQLKNGELQVRDVAIDWHTKGEVFQGTLIQRVSLDLDAAHEAAKYHRAIGTHAKFINRSEFAINLNGTKVNDKLVPLLDFHLPQVGKVTLFKSNEKAITAGGLFVKDLSDDLFESLPNFIRKVFDKNALVIQLPKSVALNRERNDFQDSEQFMAHLKRHLPQALYGAYLSLFLKSEAALDEIPYDFYNKIFERLDAMRRRNPDVEKDAFILNMGGSLRDYSKYRDSELLTDLMCYLNIIDYKENERAEPKRESIVALGLIYQQRKLKEAILPPALNQLISYDHLSRMRIEDFNKKTDEIALFRDLEWAAIPHDKTKHLNLFIELCQKIASAFSKVAIQFSFSTGVGNALAYMYDGQKTIYWNIVNVFNASSINLLLMPHQQAPIPYHEFNQVLKSMMYAISHELTHINDASSHCTGTHNHAFYLRQRQLLSENITKVNTAELYKMYVAVFNRDLANQPLLGAIDSIKAYLTPLVSELEQRKKRRVDSNIGFFSSPEGLSEEVVTALGNSLTPS
jgi:signal transduction histidine kinase